MHVVCIKHYVLIFVVTYILIVRSKQNKTYLKNIMDVNEYLFAIRITVNTIRTVYRMLCQHRHVHDDVK